MLDGTKMNSHSSGSEIAPPQDADPLEVDHILKDELLGQCNDVDTGCSRLVEAAVHLVRSHVFDRKVVTCDVESHASGFSSPL